MTLFGASVQAASPANANQVVLDQLRAFDESVGNIGYELAANGVGLCPSATTPLSGVRVHTLGQYGAAVREDAKLLFGMGDFPAVLTVAPESPAAKAGLMVGDWIVSVDGQQIAHNDYSGVAEFDARMAVGLAGGKVSLLIERGGQRRTIVIAGQPGCRSRVELVPGKKLNAAADGNIVQITTAVVGETRGEDELAFVIAHEMAHNILGHAARLDRTGRSAANIRATETEADLLALKLMKAAGYDPMAAAQFWARFGRKTGAGIFSDGTHMRTKDRVRLLADEAAKLAQ